MPEKSPQKNSSKKPAARTLKEKRSDKKAKHEHKKGLGI